MVVAKQLFVGRGEVRRLVDVIYYTGLGKIGLVTLAMELWTRTWVRTWDRAGFRALLEGTVATVADRYLIRLLLAMLVLWRALLRRALEVTGVVGSVGDVAKWLVRRSSVRLSVVNG